MVYETLEYDVHDRIGRLTFNTPETLNSITDLRLTEFADVVGRMESDEGLSAVIVTGSGRAFCVGLDLGLLDRAFADYAYFETVLRSLNGTILKLERLPIPTIAAVNGPARAGGFEIALACDMMVIADDAKIGDNHTYVGVMPGGGSTQRLPRRIGVPAAKELIWSARWLTGQEAVEIGLAFKCVASAALQTEAESLARSFTDKPRQCLAAVKRAIDGGVNLPIKDGVEFEIATFLEYGRTHPHGSEGFFAYRQGRPPAWARKT